MAAHREKIWDRPKPVYSCPFCGGETRVIVALNRTDGPRRYAVKCEACEARGPVKDTPADATYAWHERNQASKGGAR